MSMEKFIEIVSANYHSEKIKTILELGSRDGEDAIKLAKFFTNAKVITFECNPETYSIVVNNTQQYKNIIPYNLAVSDIDGEIDFYQSIHGNPGSSSIFEKTGKYDHIENYIQNKIRVKSTRIETILKTINVEQVDLVWADLQGAELKAFKGMGEYIKDVKCLLTEVEYQEMYKGQPLYEDIKLFLEKESFIEVYKTSFYGNFWGDAIFIKNKYGNI